MIQLETKEEVTANHAADTAINGILNYYDSAAEFTHTEHGRDDHGRYVSRKFVTINGTEYVLSVTAV